ncbi:MAG: 30S ribosomal protein S17 [Nanoarchaeota archaeon]|nr:30S ribosomal protein S17 [Nanoarchaeota archaeon]
MAKEKAKSKKQETKNDLTVVEQAVPTRGRTFEGTVTKKFPKRVVIEFERTVYFKKYERFSKKKTRIHARLPQDLHDSINVGDYIKVQECRPLSKIIHFVVKEKVRSGEAAPKPQEVKK